MEEIGSPSLEDPFLIKKIDVDDIMFSCGFCNSLLNVESSGPSPVIFPCSCPEAQEALLTQHRQEQETKRKQGSRQRRDRGPKR